jgi:Family of unknown function (DUF5343)
MKHVFIGTGRTEAAMPVTRDKPAPYTAPSAILEVIGRYRSRGLTTPIDKEVLGRAGVSGGLLPRTLQSLQALDLIDEKGMPTSTLEALRLAPEVEYKKRLEDWLKGTYADVFAFVDPTKDDAARVRDAFRSYQPIGQQDRMVTLFEGLCVAAGLMAEKAARPGRPPTTPQQRATVKRIVTERFKDAPRYSSRTTSSGVPAPLAGLLASLPADGEGWTKEARERFMATFGTVLDFCFPIVKPEKESGGQKTAA